MTEIIKRYKFIHMVQRDAELFEKKPVYRVLNNKTCGQLAVVSWYQPWKQYVFSSQPECVFNNSCLRDVLNFMEEVKP